jgi:Domain of unknown function (DUF389)
MSSVAGLLDEVEGVSRARVVPAVRTRRPRPARPGAAGVAGMLALETRASSGVGVAISVTTIPAAAYLGVAAGLGEFDQATGALGVLGTNVAMMVVGAVGTLVLQSALMRRAAARRLRAF